MLQVSEAEVFRACRTLFGPELQLNRDFLSYLQPDGVRSAYRKKAKVIHPDKFSIAAADVQARQQRLFQDLNQAHQTVLDYLKQRQLFKRSTTSYRSSTHVSPQSTQRHEPPNAQRSEPPKGYRQTGPLPARPLQLGLFLYYQGIITFKSMINAITWQRGQRPNLGDIAIRWGWLNSDQVRQVIFHRGGYMRFGEKAVSLGMLNVTQVRTLVFYQRSLQKKFGQYFIEEGIFDEATLNHYLQQLAEHNLKFRQQGSGLFY